MEEADAMGSRALFHPPDQNRGGHDVAKSLNTSFDHNGCRKEFKFSGPFRDFPSWASPDEPIAINSKDSFRIRPISGAVKVC